MYVEVYEGVQHGLHQLVVEARQLVVPQLQPLQEGEGTYTNISTNIREENKREKWIERHHHNGSFLILRTHGHDTIT